MTPRTEAVEAFYRDRWLAHRVIFKHRHPKEPALFHPEMVREFHSDIRFLCQIGFRGSAKSTYSEEGVTLLACLRDFRHALLVGSTLDLACQRLHSIRRQFEKNEDIKRVFGELRGKPWGDELLETTTGITMQAMGRGQAIRGTKNEDYRPDLIVADDIEDKTSVATPEGREKVASWFFQELLPSGDIDRLRVRVLANDMHVECIANQLENPKSGFVVRRYPVLYKDDLGHDQSSWPSRFPVVVVHEIEARLNSVGRRDEFEQEYMCRSTTPAAKLFHKKNFRWGGVGDVPAQVRTWQAVYGAFDPARTVGANSADTGHCRWSWISNRLVVWDAWGRRLLPDEIVGSIFDADADQATGRMTKIGVDEVGLSEFLLQPIRHESLKRGITLPIVPLKLRENKHLRIRALQPWFAGREIIFAQPLPDLEAQLNAYPTGKIDILDMLAVALTLRPGEPVYADFTMQNVMAEATEVTSLPWLALNATGSLVTAALLIYKDGRLTVLMDWVREGDAGAILKDIIQEANLEAGRECRLAAPPQHWERYANHGLTQAAKRIPCDVRRGVAGDAGRGEIRALLRRQIRGNPALLVSPAARWTLNAFAGGYAKTVGKTGMLSEEAEANEYRVLMEGIESWAGLLKLGAGSLVTEDGEDVRNYATTSDGHRYISSIPRR